MASQQVKTDSKDSPMINSAGSTVSKAMPCFKNMISLEREIRDRISGKFNTGADKKNELQELVERIMA